MDMRTKAARIDWIEREIAALKRRLGAVTHQSSHYNFKFTLKTFNALDRQFEPAVAAWEADRDDKAKSRAVLLLCKEWNGLIDAEMKHTIDYYFAAETEAA